MGRLKVTKRAKRKASSALARRKKLPKSKRFGITKKKAKKLGIKSGVARAKQLKRSKSISTKDACSVGNFYSRFKNKRSKRAEGAIDLWGGRSFGRKARSHCKKAKKKRGKKNG